MSFPRKKIAAISYALVLVSHLYLPWRARARPPRPVARKLARRACPGGGEDRRLAGRDNRKRHARDPRRRDRGRRRESRSAGRRPRLGRERQDALSRPDRRLWRALERRFASRRERRAGAGYWNANVVPQVERRQALCQPTPARTRSFAVRAIAARLVAPSNGIIKGTSALVSTADGYGQEVILAGARRAAFEADDQPRRPAAIRNSPMGALTLVRQAFYDAGWYGQAWEAFARHPELERPERSDALAALGNYLAKPPVVIDASERALLPAGRSGRRRIRSERHRARLGQRVSPAGRSQSHRPRR